MYGWKRTPSGNWCQLGNSLMIVKLARAYPRNVDRWALEEVRDGRYTLVMTFPTMRAATEYVRDNYKADGTRKGRK